MVNAEKSFFYSDEIKLDINNLNAEQQDLYDELSRKLDEKNSFNVIAGTEDIGERGQKV